VEVETTSSSPGTTLEYDKNGDKLSAERIRFNQEIEQLNFMHDELLTYQPTELDLFMTIKNGEFQRLIWGEPLELRERETTHWEKFMEYIKEN